MHTPPRPASPQRYAAAALVCAMTLCATACTADRGDRIGFDGVQITPCPGQQALERQLAGVTARLRVAFPEAYAGRRVSCNPLQVVVLLKGDTRYRTRTMQWPRGDVTVSFVSGSLYSSKDLGTILGARTLDRWFPDPDGMSVDAVNGQLEVGAAGDAKFSRYQAAAREAEKSLGVPIVVKRKRGTIRL